MTALKWVAGLSGIALLAALVLGIVFWPYLGIAGLWFGIWRRYRRLERRQQ